MTFLAIAFTVLTAFNIIYTLIIVNTERNRRYVAEIAKKFGRYPSIEKYQVFFDKEKLQQTLEELKISGRTTDMFLEAKNYYLFISQFDVRIYYSFPKTENALMPYDELSVKNLLTVIEKASIKPTTCDNIVYFSKYKAGV